MSPCPDLSTLDDLSASEREAHLAGCESCSSLFALRAGGEEEFSEECERIEMLLAITSEGKLNALDEKRLVGHLASCGRCTGLAGELLLATDQEAAEIPAPVWKHASELMSAQGPANDQRKLIIVGLSVLAAAALLFVILGSGKDDKSEEHAASKAPDAITVTRAQPDKVNEQPSNNEDPSNEDPDESENTSIGASRPAPELQAAPTPSVKELMTRSKKEVKDTNYEEGFDLCRAALKQEPKNQEAHMICAIAACNLKRGPEAKEHYNQIRSSQRKNGLKQICLRLEVPGFKLEMPDASASSDEEQTIDELIAATRKAIKGTQYGKGLKLARMVIEREPGHQDALMSAVISSCNLKNGAVARKYFRQIKSAQRRNGLKQICLRLGVPGFDDD